MNDFGIEVVHNGILLTLAPERLDVSTGDTARTLTTTATPSTASISPTFSVASYTNPNSSCAATVAFAASSGVGSADTVVTASPAGCSRIADGVRANVGNFQSTNTSKVVVPPQAMIRTILGEAGGQPGDLDQQALLVVARNRFGNSGYPGGTTATWQAVLVPEAFYGAANTTADGPAQELRNAAKVFAGEVGDIVGGAGCYWSPRTFEWDIIRPYLTPGNAKYGSTSYPQGLPHDPACGLESRRQIVYKQSLGLNVSGGAPFVNAPVFLFVRPRGQKDPAVVQIP